MRATREANLDWGTEGVLSEEVTLKLSNSQRGKEKSISAEETMPKSSWQIQETKVCITVAGAEKTMVREGPGEVGELGRVIPCKTWEALYCKDIH